jgi:hypothetical protein
VAKDVRVHYWNEARQRIYDWMANGKLEAYAELYKGGGYVYLDELQVKQILRIALNSQIAEAVKLAQTTQDELLRLGHFEYRDLTEKF